MTLVLAAILLVALLLLAGLFGPRVVRAAAPTLRRTPRLAVLAMLGTLAAWLAGVAAIGPMLAWRAMGHDVALSGPSGAVCRRCLAAADPWALGGGFDAVGPTVLLALPVLLLGAVVAVSMLVSSRGRAPALHEAGSALRRAGRARTVLGFRVTVVGDSHPVAYSLPARHCGIVISQRLIDEFSDDELLAVLTHENAHLRQKHHLVLALTGGIGRRLRWVPLITAIAEAVPHYLEIAADDAARRRTGTPALARALLKLGESGRTPAPAAPAPHAAPLALHAAGVDRIRHLTARRGSPGGKAAALALTGTALLLVGGAAVVHLPYALAVIAGCAQT